MDNDEMTDLVLAALEQGGLLASEGRDGDRAERGRPVSIPDRGCTRERAQEIVTQSGRIAYRTGMDINRCPYTPDQESYQWWLDGWNEAKADHDDAIAGARS